MVLLGDGVLVEVIRIGVDGSVVKKVMKYGDYRVMVKQSGYHYQVYELGLSQFKLD